MLTRDLQELLLWSLGISGVIAIVYLLLLWILRLRGVFVTRTKFGVTMVFDSVDADKTPVRLLNVNGTYQSVCSKRPPSRACGGISSPHGRPH